MIRGRPRGGITLLEVMVALAVMGSVGTAALWLTSEAVGSVVRAQNDETMLRQANRLMTSVSLWPREDLIRHLGVTEQGPFLLVVERPVPQLYRVSVLQPAEAGVPPGETVLAHRAADARTVLETVVYQR